MAGAADNYVYSRFRVTVTVGDIVFEDEVVSVSATYALNDIPTASATIACGVNMRTSAASKIHSVMNTLKPRTEATIDVTIETPHGRINKSPPESHRVFEGYYIGIGIQRAENNANFILKFVHWLDDLNCGSILNGNWYPGSAADMAQTALYGTLANAPDSGVRRDGFAVPLADPELKIITPRNMSEDLWGFVFKPILSALANKRHPMTQGRCFGPDNNSKIVLRALEKIPNGAPTQVPLRLKLPATEPVLLGLTAQAGISKMMTNGLAYNTVWSKLVSELAASFLFAVSPAATCANVIPFFGGLQISANGTAWRTIRLNDYNYANFNSSQRQLIESINVFYPYVSNSNVAANRLPSDDKRSSCRPLATYPDFAVIAGQAKEGVIMVRELPTWLYNNTEVGGYAHAALLPELDTLDPGRGEPTPTGGVKTRPPTTLDRHQSIVKNYCEHWYKTEILNQRFGELSGKLRFDIAPGSMLAIEIPPQPPPFNPMSSGREPDHMYASVTRVSYVIDAEQHKAGTSFVLSNLRTELENKDLLLVSPDAPLYAEPWYGGPLSVMATGDNTGP